MPEFSELTVQILEPPTFQYIPSIDANAWQKVEVVKQRDLVDGFRSREMVWHRYSYAEAVSGPYETLFDVPFGLASVSGDPLF